MPTLTYDASGFSVTRPSPLSGNHDIQFAWSELLWAAISVGRAGMRDILKFGVYSEFEIVYRAALLYANLREVESGHLIRSDAYNALDPSEKSAVSYFLGLTLSKLFAERCLQVPWLLHLDVYRKRLAAVLEAGKSRPDLIGQDTSGSWVVLESKGRTNDFDQAALAKAKAQSRKVRTVSGALPKYRMGIQSYFESSVLRLAVDDPEREEAGVTLDLPITTEMMRHDYYQPFRDWTATDGLLSRFKLAGKVYIVRTAPAFDFAVGIVDDIYARSADSVTIDQSIGVQFSAGAFAGPDGVLVLIGSTWSDENMRKPPEARHS